MEKREFSGGRVEARQVGARRIIEGIIPYNSNSNPIQGAFIEQIAPGAFARALSGAEPVILVRAHLDHEILASTSGGSLKLTDSPQGLRFEAELRDTESMRDLFELVRRDADELSFGFVVRKDSWPTPTTRRLEDVKLVEITCGLARGQAAYPAAHAATALRSQQEATLKRLRETYGFGAGLEGQAEALAAAQAAVAFARVVAARHE